MLLSYLNNNKNLENIIRFSLVLRMLGAFGTEAKAFESKLDELEIRGRIETLIAATLRRSARKLRMVRKFEDNRFH